MQVFFRVIVKMKSSYGLECRIYLLLGLRFGSFQGDLFVLYKDRGAVCECCFWCFCFISLVDFLSFLVSCSSLSLLLFLVKASVVDGTKKYKKGQLVEIPI